jgi:hypothetical protein
MVRSEDGWDPSKNPKPRSFVENLSGNQRPVTVDTHATRLPATIARDPRWLALSLKTEKDVPPISPKGMLDRGEISMDEALERPAFWDAIPKKTEYGALERLYQDIARKKGMSPAQAQASAWVGGAESTGMQSGADPFLKVFEDRVRITAEKTGEPPEAVLRRFIRGEISLYNRGGAVPLAA